jgi:hypothetical protein
MRGVCPAAPVPAGSIPSPSLITEALRNRAESFPGIKAYLELEFHEPKFARPQRILGQLAYRKEKAHFYLKTFSPLVPHLFTLLAKGDTFWLLVPKLATLYTGPLRALGREDFEIKITPQDVQRLLVLSPPAEDNEIQVEDRQSYWAVFVYEKTPQGRLKQREIWLGKDHLEVLRDIRYSVTGDPYLDLSWSDYTSGLPFARRMTLVRPPSGFRMTLFFKQWEITDAIPENWFELRAMEGLRTETVEA